MRNRCCVLLLTVAALGCSTLPTSTATIHKIAIRPVLNKTQQFGLEDALTSSIRDEFLHDGSCSIVPESEADSIVLITLNRYTVTPIQYDLNLVATAYKLSILADLQFISHATNTVLWEEKNMQGIETYPAQGLRGGMSEASAQAQIWDNLSRDIVARVTESFHPAPANPPSPH